MNEHRQATRDTLNRLIYVIKSVKGNADIESVQDMMIELIVVLREHDVNILTKGVTLLLMLAMMSIERFTAVVKLLDQMVIAEMIIVNKKKNKG